jgi:hypothetical protein
MGIGMAEVNYLVAKGYLSNPSARVLDIGAQNLHNATVASLRRLAEDRGTIADERRFLEKAEKIALKKRGLPYASELFELLGIEYTSYDICPGPKTEVFDLNRDGVPPSYRGRFDLVLNCGTTEHVVNQLNCLRVMHDALAVGGVAFHQVPAFGYFGHGYFCYHKEFFRDFAVANGYDVADLWYNFTGYGHFVPQEADVRDPHRPLEPNSDQGPYLPPVPSYNITAVLRKREERPLALSFEIETSSSPLAEEIVERYFLPNVSGLLLLREIARRAVRRIVRPASAWPSNGNVSK